MDYLIFAKWSIDYLKPNSPPLMPSIITTLIDMALKVGGVSETNGKIFEG